MSLVLGAMVVSVAPASAARADSPKAEPMRLQDACNKASFDATFGPGICQRNAGSVSAQEFLSKLNTKDFGHGASVHSVARYIAYSLTVLEPFG